MSNCAVQDPEELMAFLDGELTADRAAAVHAHLVSCETCQRLQTELRGVSRDLARWDGGEAPRSLTAPAAAPPSPLRRWLAWKPIVLAPAAGLAALGLLLTFALHRMTSSALGDLPAPAAATATATEERYDASRAGGTLGHLQTRPGGTGGSRAERNAALPRAGAAPPPEAEIEKSRDAVSRVQPQTLAAAPAADAAKAPMIARVVSLRIVANDFDRVRPSVDKILSDVGGFVGQLSASGARGESRTLTGTVRVPADRLADAVTALRALGQVIQESQSGEDVTEQAVDLDARLTNARNTEKRLTDVLEHRTGKVGDVLAVEREIARVREEIERMDAERTNLHRRVAYATITLEIVEERKAALDLGPLPVSAQIRNAIVDGFRGAFESALGAALLAARVGPSLVLWGVLLMSPAWIVYRRRRRATA
jgi:hypothetical protein